MDQVARYAWESRCAVLVVGMLLAGCERQAVSPPASDHSQKAEIALQQSDVAPDQKRRHRTPVGPATQRGNPPANVLFSKPGRYQSPNSNWSVEIRRESQTCVAYRPVWSDKTGELSLAPICPLSEKELVMCWDERGRLWTYHPAELVHCCHFREFRFVRSFVGSGSKVRHEMPIAFRKSLPENIEEMLANAVADSPDGGLHFPLKHRALGERAPPTGG